ncbi:MAG: DUF418 domain-containing protein [Planctomycetota bacterium]
MPSTATQPISPKYRIVAIDVLRGFALLGILLMNIRSFSMIGTAYFNPEAAGPISSVDHTIWWLGQLLADQKFMALFSMLFGAGVVLMYERRDAEGLGSAGLHYRRMIWLGVIGVLHAYVLWFGDILYAYAMCGLWLFLLRRRGPILLISLGLVLLIIGSGLNALIGWSVQYWPEESQAEMLAFTQPDAQMIADETAARRGGWWSQMAFRAPLALELQTFFFVMWGIWRAGGVMLLGMGLLKLGVLRGTAPTRVYVTLIVLACAVGLPLIASDLWRYPANERGSIEAMFLGTLGNYWGSVLLAMGYASVIILVVRSGALSWITAPLAAVGRMALTNYLAQSVICHALFYGTLGIGLLGKLNWSQQMGIVTVIWAIQLAWSTWWLKRHSMGPMEALWRRLSYGKRPSTPPRVTAG